MKKKNTDNLSKGTDKFLSGSLGLDSISIPKTKKISHFIISLLIIVSLFIGSFAVVWIASTDSQRAQTVLFFKQALQGDIDFSILQDTKFQALGYINWPWDEETKISDEKIEPLQKQKITTFFQSSSKYKNLFSCRKPSSLNVDKIRVYQWKDSKGQTHMGDHFPKTNNYHDLTIKNINTDSFFKLKLDSRYSKLPPFASDRMKRDVDQIYKILTHDIGVSKFNQITLNLKLFDDKNRFNTYKAKVAPGMGTAGGFYISRINEASVYTGRNDDRMYEVTKHEATHAIVNGAFGRTPTWLNEGLAEYFEALSFKNGMTRTIKPDNKHLKLLSRAGVPRLKDHFNLTNDEWYAESIKNKHYALAWSLVYFMMSSDKNKQFLKYMLDHLAYNYCKPFNDIAYINGHYPGGLSGFEMNWRKWLVSSKSEHRY
ncbi:MAG: DUF1570 domain-containing protein [gamma proteobacterium symbiont of Taylorina sp.]|nr:DUF1570 domain-containing protein [gamma proteobacterium symbiont of Taylorina sp.]